MFKMIQINKHHSDKKFQNKQGKNQDLGKETILEKNQELSLSQKYKIIKKVSFK